MIGSLETGKRADLVVLDRDVLSIDPETIEDTKVIATYLDGRLIYNAPGSGLVPATNDDEAVSWGRRETRMREWLKPD